MSFERYVWLLALIRYFDIDATPQRPMAAVLDALGVTNLQFQDARTTHELPIIAEVMAGKHERAGVLAAELSRAREAILEARPTLDDLKPKPAQVEGRESNETVMMKLALPAAALPFREGPAVTPPPAEREPVQPSAVEETVSMPVAGFTRGDALPFQKPTDETEETLIQPSPSPRPAKKRSDR